MVLLKFTLKIEILLYQIVSWDKYGFKKAISFVYTVFEGE